MVLRTFGHKREGGTRDWRKLRNEELYKLYFLLSVKMEEEMGRVCSKHGREEKDIQNFGRKTFFMGFIWLPE
jgi:hypothetical protein